jgi:diguanylate cyclase (GGDEF)-like protein
VLTRIRKLAAWFVAVLVGGTTAFFVFSFIGQLFIHDSLTRQASALADRWYYGSMRAADADLGNLIERLSQAREHAAMDAAQVDALLLLDTQGAIAPVGGTSTDVVSDFLRATAKERSALRLIAAALPTGVYTNSSIGLTEARPFHSWVLLPATDDERRLAIRINQSVEAAHLMRSFQTQILYTGGLGAVTFFAFMAGYTQRTRQLKGEDAQMRFLALHDELTGLPNRKHFEKSVFEAMEKIAESEKKMAIMLMDLDGFKAVNDTLGHPVGDGLLKAAGERLSGSLRGGDLLARLSGDEFAILVPQVSDVANLVPMAERVQKLLAKPFSIEGHEILVGCSMGIAVSPDNGNNLKGLMRNADFALYRAKREGKRTWRFFDPHMAEDLNSRRTLEDGLRFALARDLFSLLYQPQVDLETGAVLGYEALLRWRLPGKGLVPTSMFLSVAEETGLIVPMGEWVIRQAARDCALLPEDVRVAINLSAAQLKQPGVEELLATTLGNYKIDPSRIEIEVNESILGRHEETAFTHLEKIRDLGVSIVMDNFGVGTSSLGLLTRHPFDKIKVARRFVNGIRDDHKTRAVVAAICSLGHALDMRVAGEGVETPEHAAILRAAGCSQAQGYYFGHPKTLDELLRAHSVDLPEPELAQSA